jgi:hypothetical protein
MQFKLYALKMFLKSFVLINVTLFLLVNGQPINQEYVINGKCTAGMVIGGATFGASVGGSFGAALGAWVFTGVGMTATTIIGIIIGSTTFGGGAGVLSSELC